MNIPDRWIVLKFIRPDITFYKVLAGWSGGYLHGDSWMLNSGIVEIIETDEWYDFIGYSGSVYRCWKGAEGFTSLSGSVYNELIEKAKIENTSIEVIEDISTIVL